MVLFSVASQSWTAGWNRRTGTIFWENVVDQLFAALLRDGPLFPPVDIFL